uniref:Uncharacterized protein n=1 Tax=Arundo donax TaxID=35708 RepID=A0A0A9H6F4_ARUDO
MLLIIPYKDIMFDMHCNTFVTV